MPPKLRMDPGGRVTQVCQRPVTGGSLTGARLMQPTLAVPWVTRIVSTGHLLTAQKTRVGRPVCMLWLLAVAAADLRCITACFFYAFFFRLDEWWMLVFMGMHRSSDAMQGQLHLLLNCSCWQYRECILCAEASLFSRSIIKVPLETLNSSGICLAALQELSVYLHCALLCLPK